MNIKRYRAATMREALEQVKRELGEDALVLDTKRVRSKGFLGFGARSLVEVRVAGDAGPSEAKANEGRAARSNSMLDLVDASPAAPARAAQTERARVPAFAALAARAYAGSAGERDADAPRSEGPSEPLTRGIEITDAAPRVVHRRPVKSASTAASSTPPASSADAPSVQRTLLGGELERLRADLREMKFSLSALAACAAPSAGASEALACFEQAPEVYDSPYYEAYLQLIATGLAPDLARRAAHDARLNGASASLGPAEVAHTGLIRTLSALLEFAADPLLAEPDQAPAGVVFIGPTGVGKTTTIAKLAARIALRARRRVELITLDTYRIAAVEQLKTYAEIIGAGCHIARSVMELDALARRHAGKAAVLIDTIGRSPHDLADQMELADYLRESTDLLKCLVLQATTHPVDAGAAVKKFALYGANRLVITKLDETARPGATISVAMDAALPLVYLCAGQRVPEDFERATAETLAARIVRARCGGGA
jgi:flagellar biosynthesis protein FlhF